METTNYTMVIIKSDTDKWLTQKENVEIQNRMFTKEIYLAATDSADNYVEIDNATYENYQTQLDTYNNKLKNETVNVAENK